MIDVVAATPEIARFEALASKDHLRYALSYDQLATINDCVRQIRQSVERHQEFGFRMPISQRRVAVDVDELQDSKWFTSSGPNDDVIYNLQFGHAKGENTGEVDMRQSCVGIVLGRELELKWTPLTAVGRSFRRRAARLLFSSVERGRDLNLFDNEREIYV